MYCDYCEVFILRSQGTHQTPFDTSTIFYHWFYQVHFSFHVYHMLQPWGDGVICLYHLLHESLILSNKISTQVTEVSKTKVSTHVFYGSLIILDKGIQVFLNLDLSDPNFFLYAQNEWYSYILLWRWNDGVCGYLHFDYNRPIFDCGKEFKFSIQNSYSVKCDSTIRGTNCNGSGEKLQQVFIFCTKLIEKMTRQSGFSRAKERVAQWLVRDINFLTPIVKAQKSLVTASSNSIHKLLN